MFEFGFLNKDEDKDTDPVLMPEYHWFSAKEVLPQLDIIEEIVASDSVKTFTCGGLVIKHINTKGDMVYPNSDFDNSILKAEKNHSDLLTAIYEGGRKIWECTIDLSDYLLKTNITLKNKAVLDLGCGAGIIGIQAYLNGATVYFQDYNEEVIKYLTIPNVFLNVNRTNRFDNCKFYSGDWSSFLEILNEDYKFDYIFTSETIYNPSNYHKLAGIFKKCIKSDGIIYVAAKTHYFGVGGGLRQFEEYLKLKSQFHISSCWKCSEGLQREILKISLS
ncbi:hypothetical protein FQA39_LY02596 [Lamprigera yunnana]|nr:hypothetical protein FQA39_LY02596 [Lamprigera yunnana]